MDNTPQHQAPVPRQRRAGSPLTGLLLVSLAISLLVFVLVSVFLYPLFIAYITGLGPVSAEQVALEGFTSLITLAVVAGGLVFWFVDRRQQQQAEESQKKTLSYQLFQTIHDRLVTPEQEEARRWIFANLPVKPAEQSLADWFEQATAIIEQKPPGWEQERSPGQVYIKRVLNNLDFIGFVAQHFWDASDSDIEWLSPPVAKAWLRLGPYVQHLSDLRQEPDYYRAAKDFGEFCIQWRRQQGLPESRHVASL